MSGFSRGISVWFVFSTFSAVCVGQAQHISPLIDARNIRVLDAVDGVIVGPITGACCVDGACMAGVTMRRCQEQLCGQWRGAGSTCQGQVCLSVLGGVCCVNGVCSLTIRGPNECSCAGGTFLTSAAGCGTTICPGGALGACCVDGVCVVDVTQQECVVNQCGAWLGAGTGCAPGACPAGGAGVCCTSSLCDGSVGEDACECGGGAWFAGTDCAIFTCPDPVGRCCRAGSCSDVTEVGCNAICGVWGGENTSCAGGPLGCFGAIGACCVGDACMPGLGATTCTCEGGTWFGGESCAVSGATDCNQDGLIDLCAPGLDCNGNLTPDDCEEDCNGNLVPDDCDITSGFSLDCNVNGVPDDCDLSAGTSPDCNGNMIPDECETGSDCNGNQIPDECEIGGDCNGNGVLDECELDPDCSANFGLDCNFDGFLNECDPDCQPNGFSDVCDLVNEISIDCAGGGAGVGSAFFGQLLHNGNCQVCHGFGGFGKTAPNHRGHSRFFYEWKTSGCVFHLGGTFEFTPDELANLEAWLSDLGGGGNGVPDECEGLADCDGDGVADECVLASGMDADCNGNGVPDGCDLSSLFSNDCNVNGIPDECEGLPDCNGNLIPDECEGLQDCNADGVPNVCDPDCNVNGRSDICEILAGNVVDCDGNLVPDSCEADCNGNGVVDACDISGGTSPDLNGNGVPDECEVDCNGNNVPDELDIEPFDVGKTVGVQPGVGGAIPDCAGSGDAFVEVAIPVDFGVDCGSVEHLVVGLNVDHTWVGDLVVELESPSGTVIALVSRAGLDEIQPFCGSDECCGASNQGLDVTFDDGGVASIESPPPGPFAIVGEFRPDAGATGLSAALGAFSGEGECGTWLLRVHDGSELDTGVVQSVELRFELFAVSGDCNGNGVPDECDISGGTSGDCNGNGLPDDCEDCNGNGIADICELQLGAADDCNFNGLLDECELFFDCNGNGVLDECDLAGGLDVDCDGNGVPDGCDLAGTAGLVVSSLGRNSVVRYNLASSSFLGEFVTANEGGLSQPAGLAFLPNGDLLVGDVTSATIRRFDGATGSHVGDFSIDPSAVSIDLEVSPHTGNVLALSFALGVVEEFDISTGASLGIFATLPPPPLGNPSGLNMTFGPDGNLYISTTVPPDVVAFDGVTGVLIGSFVSGGNLMSPHGLTFGPNGNLFVADAVADSVQEFDGTTGVYVGDFVPAIAGATGTFSFVPIGFGPDGGFYLGYSGSNAVAYYDGVTGTLLEVYDNPGGALQLGLDLAFQPASGDCDANGVPDQCEDCNGNDLADACDIAGGVSPDVNGNGVPDECEGADVLLSLVVRASASASDTVTTLPKSDSSIGQGGAFVAELWGTDRGVLNTGLEAVYADLSFDPAVVQVVGVQHRSPFFGSVGGLVDNVAGVVSGLGGTDSGASGAGLEPGWARIAIVEFTTSACDTGTPLLLSSASQGVSAVGRGLIDPADIDFGSSSIAIGSACVYNLDGTDPINAGDFGIFAACWLTGVGDPGFDPNCDFDCSGFVDAGDFGWFAGVFGQSCDSLSEGDYPPCRRCGTTAAAQVLPGGVSVTWQVGSVERQGDGSAVIELLVRDDDPDSEGVAGVYVDVRLSDAVVAERVVVASEFSKFVVAARREGRVWRVGGATMESVKGVGKWQVFARIVVREEIVAPDVAELISVEAMDVSRRGAGWVPTGGVRVIEPVKADR